MTGERVLGKTFFIKTLGCKVNQYEEQVLRENLLKFGFMEAEPNLADIVIVNSCTVTHVADSKTKRSIRKIKRDNPRCKVYVTGCMVVLEEDISLVEEMDEVYTVVAGGRKGELAGIICGDVGQDEISASSASGGLLAMTDLGATSATPRNDGEVGDWGTVTGFQSRTRAFLKVQDGCNQRCSYCKVNMVRGPSRSRDADEIVEEAKRLINNGFKEIVLTGICIGSWTGKGEVKTLAQLVGKVILVEGDFRIRISSIEPNHVTEEFVEVIASSEKVCKHLHIPLQSGSDEMLSRMNRKYDTRKFSEIVERLRKCMPMIGITMDVIVGFPGETDEVFSETYEFVKKIQPSRLHVFKYSDRKGTESYSFPEKVEKEVAKKRVTSLIALGEEFQAKFAERFLQKEVEVLIEGAPHENMLFGYTGEYVRVQLTGFFGQEGDLVHVVPEAVKSADLVVSYGKK